MYQYIILSSELIYPTICFVFSLSFLFVGSSSSFRRVFETPIVASRQPGASPEEVELGAERGSELSRITKLFLLRRTQEINTKYLPPKCMDFLISKIVIVKC